MRYTINIDRKVKIWVNEEIDFEFEGTEEEVRKLLEKHNGDLDAISEFGDLNYQNYDHVLETEEHMTPEENGDWPTYEIKDIEVE